MIVVCDGKRQTDAGERLRETKTASRHRIQYRGTGARITVDTDAVVARGIEGHDHHIRRRLWCTGKGTQSQHRHEPSQRPYAKRRARWSHIHHI